LSGGASTGEELGESGGGESISDGTRGSHFSERATVLVDRILIAIRMQLSTVRAGVIACDLVGDGGTLEALEGKADEPVTGKPFADDSDVQGHG